MRIENCNKEEKIQVYLAAPFFNEDQTRLVKLLKNILIKEEFDVFSPMDECGILTKNDPPKERRRIFEKNIEGLVSSEYILMVIDNFDPGAIWEGAFYFGLQFATNNFALPQSKIIAYSHVPGRGLNVMLAQSCLTFVNGIQNLVKMLRALKANKPIKSEWIGEIE